MTDQITLVIDAAALERMRLDEGSLAIKARGRSEQRVPLRRLQRIDITGTPRGDVDCLLELASRSIPVTFFARGGAIRAQLFHPLPQPTSLAHWMGELFTLNGESPAYCAWREHHLRAIFRTAGIHGGSIVEQDRAYGQCLVSALSSCDLCETYSELNGVQDGLLEARIGEQLLRFGVAPGGPAQTRLAADLKELGGRWLIGKTLDWLLRLHAGSDELLFERYMRSLCSNALDEWLYLVLTRLAEVAAAGGLHRGDLA